MSKSISLRAALISALALVALAGCSKTDEQKDAPLHDWAAPAVLDQGVADDSAMHDPDSIVVDFEDGTTKEQFDALEKQWGIDLELADEEEGKDSAITVAHGVTDLDALIADIEGTPGVEAVEPLMTYQMSYVPNDPDYSKQWNLKMINMPKAWEKSKGKGVVVAVLDTGIAYEDFEDFKQVPDLKGAKFAKGYDFVNNDSHPNDDHGHGTHVAGTIAQVTNNKEGVAGVAFEATLMPVKVLDHFGSGTSAAIADAIRWAADNGANVINMSLGGGGRSAVMEKAVEYARKKGVVVVCAAGNGGRGVVEYPAAYPGSFAVSAVGPKGTLAPYSSFGKELDIAAPGGDKSQGPGAGVLQNTIDPKDPAQSIYAEYQGTSMATPHVAGVAALLFAAGAKTPDQVEKAITSSAVAVGDQQGWSERYGHGVIDAEAALKALKSVKENGELESFQAEIAPLNLPGSPLPDLTPQPPVSDYDYGTFDWKPLAWGAAMLAFVLMTLGRRERAGGFFNILVKPGFLIPFVLATAGAFFVRWLSGPSEVTAAITLPIPDWQKIIFGRGSLAHPAFYSALIPVVASFFAIKWKGFRPVVGGLSIGFAGFLGYSLWAKAPALAWMPFTFLAIPWLVVNTLICLFVARAMLKKETP
jgi:serine protease